MGNVKPWQIILIVVAFGALGFSVWKFGFGNRVYQPDGILTVDVVSGQLFDVHKGKAKGILLPVRHPDTGERTLFPIEKLQDGTWQLLPRYAPVYQEMNIANTVVESDLRVRVSSEEVTRYVPEIPTKN